MGVTFNMISDFEKARINRSLSSFTTGDDGATISEFSRSGRRFEIYKTPDAKYFASEHIPVGSIQTDGDQFDLSWADSLPGIFASNPNGFADWCHTNNIDANKVTRSIYAPHDRRILHDDLNGAIAAITDAIDTNTVLVNYTEFQTFKSEDELKSKISEISGRINYWKLQVLPKPDRQSLFADKTNMLGLKISDKAKKTILAYMNKPSLSGWEDARTYLITGNLTLWQALIEIDPTTPRSGSGFNKRNIPSKKQITQALQEAIEINNRICAEVISSLESELSKLSPNHQ